MGRLDRNVEWDGLRDVLDSSTSTSGGSGSVSMADLAQRQHRIFANNSLLADGTTYSSSGTDQAKDFRGMVRVNTASTAVSYSVPLIKGSAVTYLYGWSTAGGSQGLTASQTTTAGGSCWDGTTNHTTSAMSVSGSSGFGFDSNIWCSGIVNRFSIGLASMNVIFEGAGRATAANGFDSISAVRDSTLHRNTDVRGAANNVGQGTTDSYLRRVYTWGSTPASNILPSGPNGIADYAFCNANSDVAWFKFNKS